MAFGLGGRVTADRAALAVVWVGMLAFVGLHSFLFLEAVDERTRSLVRAAWFGGLGLVAVLAVSALVRDA
ncbi:hypothetical protein [Halorussus halobius]|uniref:hypothetical protein n=1 Tax=Halorussus halobius TaxID=1710537 RepID=UPI0010929D79|nr:hypothetical protein [Halorussus halobius]